MLFNNQYAKNKWDGWNMDKWDRDEWDRWDADRYCTLIDSLVVKNKAEERKDNRMIYHIKFEGTDKLYAYYCEPNVYLQVGCSYMIEADHSTTYKNPITVVKIDNNKPTGVHIRTITHARLLTGAKRPDDRIKRVIFNKEKLTTVVIWYDGQKTIVKCQEGDVWDEEKALALCYMKRVLGNRGSFNETLKKYCNHTEEVEA